MGVIPYENEITSSIPPAKMFKAFVLDVDKLNPKILPQTIKCVEIIEGVGGAGTIKKVTFGEGSQFNYVKHRVDGIDKENLTYSYSVIEGNALMGTLESISYEVKFAASPDGGSICKTTSKYNTKGEIDIKEDQIKAGKEKASGMFKAIEAYPLANPDAY
ncbi:major allergen Pru ar 1-like [Vitis riparia]|uniref:major allergen Pru ar 1-like n=1 Tax=Vitis riparia TaxID=96939 RepID=UPI00155AA080|nr:major allergen Pru ar 1-like [Vitis riparia]